MGDCAGTAQSAPNEEHCDLARPLGQTSNPDALFETLENWNNELKKIDSPVFRSEAKP